MENSFHNKLSLACDRIFMEFSTCGLFLLVFAPTSAFYLLTFFCWHSKLTEKLPWQFSSFRTLHHPGPQGYHPVRTTSVQRSKLRNQHWSIRVTKAQSLWGFHWLSHPCPFSGPRSSPGPTARRCGGSQSSRLWLFLRAPSTFHCPWPWPFGRLPVTRFVAHAAFQGFVWVFLVIWGPHGAEVRCLLGRHVMSHITAGDPDHLG